MADVVEKTVSGSLTNVTVTTTSETQVGTARVPVPLATCRVLIKAWLVLTLGTGTTAVTTRIRRGIGLTGTQLNDATAEAIKTAAGSTEPFCAQAILDVQDADAVEVTLSVQQTAASANGTVTEFVLQVEVLNG
jgi:hypothetical protein